MGWARTLLLGDIGNRLDIQDTEEDIRSLRSRLSQKAERDAHQDSRLATLEAENDALKLCVSALSRLLVAKGVLSEADLRALAAGLEE